MSENDERLFSMLIYLLGVFTPLVGPLIVWLIKRQDSDFIDYHGKQYLNFMISYTIYGGVCSILIAYGIITVTYAVSVFAILLSIAVGTLFLIFLLLALIRANAGERYRIPFVIPIIR